MNIDRIPARNPSRVRRLAHGVVSGIRTVYAALDAGSMIAHGIDVPRGHPARRPDQS